MVDDVEAGIGATLRDAREARGRSQQDVAQALRARVSQVQALEDEDFSGFGGEVYVRGFLRSYAAEVGVDPGPLMQQYDREYGAGEVVATPLVTGVRVPSPRSGGSPVWVVWVLVAVVALAAVGVLSSLGSGRAPDQAATDDDPVGPPPASVPSDDDMADDAGDAGDADDATDDVTDNATDDAGSDDAPADDAQADDAAPDDDGSDDAPDPEPEGAELVLALEEDSWMRVLVDGSLTLEETVAAGETLQFSGEEIQVRFGNAGGVYVELNGEDLGVQGSRGEVVDVTFTRDGAERT